MEYVEDKTNEMDKKSFETCLLCLSMEDSPFSKIPKVVLNNYKIRFWIDDEYIGYIVFLKENDDPLLIFLSKIYVRYQRAYRLASYLYYMTLTINHNLFEKFPNFEGDIPLEFKKDHILGDVISSIKGMKNRKRKKQEA